MDKKYYTKLAIIGLTSGLIIAKYPFVSAKENAKPKTDLQDDRGNLGYFVMTEDELLLELNEEGENIYNSLDSKGKALAREVASQRCNGMNKCAGLNACRTDTNKCAGQGSCKGLSKCGFSDKNLAVKVAAMKSKKLNQKDKKSSSNPASI